MTALLIIDVQVGFNDAFWGSRNNPNAEANIAKLLSYWRSAGRPVVHIRHDSTTPSSPLHPSNPGNAIKPEVAPMRSEKVFGKNVNSGFIGTGLEEYLRAEKIGDLVIVGLTTDHCVSTTTRMAGNIGFGVKLVADATATFDRTDRHGVTHSADSIHAIHLASLDGEFCQVVMTEELINDES